jgi:uncharacterized protein YjbI with pentapeptide repeats
MNPNEKKITSKELLELLQNPTDDILESHEEGAAILIDGYIIEDDHLMIYDIETDRKITFKNCDFNNENLFYIDSIECNEDVIFEACKFPKGLIISQSTFKKELCFKYVYFEDIRISGGSFEKISISGYDVKEISISNVNFENLHIGEYLINQTIGEFVIFCESNEVGNIIAREQSFEKIYISGSNKGSKFDFENIKCNDVTIDSFLNEGSLNFYGIEPLDLTSDKRYFQIVNSNLEKAQFFRANFSNYQELVIIDSFITDCLFIGCKWGNNIRAIRGIGYGTFEKSLKTGRKITIGETSAIKEAYRQLKISMSKHSDKIQENRFYAEELNYHNKTLPWTKPWENQFWDKLILYASKIFSNYGQNFGKSLFWLLFGHLTFFILAISLGGFELLHINVCHPTSAGFKEAFEKYFVYINPIRSPETSFSGYLIFLDLLMRIWASYMIYNLIRTSRRFIS